MEKKAKDLARRWMPGLRHAFPGRPRRPAWAHPADLVRFIDEELPDCHGVDKGTLKIIAWMHDLIEDGRTEFGERVDAVDLRREGFSESVVRDVIALTHVEGTDKALYFAALQSASLDARIVKVIDRICNLREGKSTFKPTRWERYVKETRALVIPIALTIPEPVKSTLLAAIEAAIA